MSFKILLILLFTFLLPAFLFSQSVGKIIGVVTDAETGNPLPGVNITIDNSLLGAQTDLDGYYIIMNVPVGVYTVRASFIGFRDMVIQNIRVSAQISTETNFTLEEQPLELGEAIVITAERPLVEKHVTHSYALMTAEEIESIPVRDINDILNLQPGVVVQDGNVYIRGGRTEEVGYYLDGTSITNPINNTQSVKIVKDAIEEIQVLTGGYTAEYGGANSGIIRTELKTGGSDFHVSLDAQTDNFTGRGGKFLDTYSYGHSIISGTISGPIYGDQVRFFAALENEYEADWRKRWSKSYRFENLVDNNYNNPKSNPAALFTYDPDTVDIYYPGGHTPNNNLNRWSINSTLMFDFSPYKIRLSGAYSYFKFRNDFRPMLTIFNSRQEWTNNYNGLVSLKFTHVLNPNTFYNIRLSYFTDESYTEDPWFGTDWRAWNDSVRVADYTHGEITYRDRWLPPWPYVLNAFTFDRDGAPAPFYVEENNSYWGGTIDLVSQPNKYHEVKVGLDIRYYTLRRFSIRPRVMEEVERAGSEAAVDPGLLYHQTGNTYGYDFWGNEINSGFNGPKHPLFAAFYIQDKIEFKDLIINAGLRFDYFDTDDRILINPANPDVDLNLGLLAESAWRDKKPITQISPRLGMSFPAGEKTVFYAQYGKFIQMTELNDIYYSNLQFARQIVSGGFFYSRPVGYNIDPIRTTQYEIGFRQQLGQSVAIEIAGYYKNIIGQTRVRKVDAEANALIKTYWVITNGDFATTKGIEVKLTMRRIGRLQGKLYYTLSNAEGTGAEETSYYGAIYRGSQIPTVTSPLDFEHRHRGSVMIDYRFGPADGGPIMERSGVNLVFTFNSGHPYTYTYVSPGGQRDSYGAGVGYLLDVRERQALEPLNSSTTPWNFNVDLRLDKTISIDDNIQLTFYARVKNLFNNKNVLNVYPKTGSATDDGYIYDKDLTEQNIRTWGEKYIDLYKAINIKNGQAYLDFTGNELFGSPRQIWFGAKISY